MINCFNLFDVFGDGFEIGDLCRNRLERCQSIMKPASETQPTHNERLGGCKVKRGSHAAHYPQF